MTTPLDEDNYLLIRRLSYDRPTEGTERFYFSAMSTLQVTTLLPSHTKIILSDIYAYLDNSVEPLCEDVFLEENTISSFKTIGDFNDFFINNSSYYIHNCKLHIEGGIVINSHDDGEVSIQFLSSSSEQSIINTIFEKYCLDKKLIETLKNKCGHFIAIDNQSNIVGEFKEFSDYLKSDLFLRG